MTAGSATRHLSAAVAPAGGRRAPRYQDWVDRFVGSDPGLNRFRMALQTVVTIGIALLAEYAFVHVTHALQIDSHGGSLPAAQQALIAAQHHGVLIIAMMLGAIIGMLSAFGASDPTPRGQLVTMLLMPIPMVASLALGLALGGYRELALASLAVLLAIGTYLRRFGPRGFLAGQLLFMGDFFGFFLHGEIQLRDLGWVTAELLVGLAVAIVVNFTVFYPSNRQALRRTQRSYAARARKVAGLALAVLDTTELPAGERERAQVRTTRRLERGLVRLNETALMIDAQLADPSALPPRSSAQLLHQGLFDAELALTNVARFGTALARKQLPAPQRRAVRDALLAVRHGNLEQAELAGRVLLDLLADAGIPTEPAARATTTLLRRFATSTIGYADALRDWLELGDDTSADDARKVFSTQSVLFAGWLPGSAMVSAAASMEAGRAWRDRITLAPYTRTAIQMGVAVGAAIAVGDVLSGRRFYWAVIAAFITFMGANNAGEQMGKAFYRVAGTVVGIMAGSALVHLVGHDTTASVAIILVSLFIGLYLMRINYTFMVIGITVMVSQLYVQLDEYTDHLLLLRLEETSIGAAIAVATVLVVLPLRTKHVLAVAVRGHLQALRELVAEAGRQLVGTAPRTGLRDESRALDAAYQSLLSTAQPLRRNVFGGVHERLAETLQVLTASRNYSRELVTDVGVARCNDEQEKAEISAAVEALLTSMDRIVAATGVGTGEQAYVRSASMLASLRQRHGGGDDRDPLQLAVGDLQQIDGTMARLAALAGLPVTDLDTGVEVGAGEMPG